MLYVVIESVETIVYMWVLFFFFQAEDGIRDLVRSRGLGDVYKRQEYKQTLINREEIIINREEIIDQKYICDFEKICSKGSFEEAQNMMENNIGPVSYTHLTLPTSDLV